jgi:hypothetical protein
MAPETTRGITMKAHTEVEEATDPTVHGARSRAQRRAIVVARAHRLARQAERQALTVRLLLTRAM